MKVNIKNIILVALMFGTLIGYANDSTNPTNTVNQKRVKVEFKSVMKEQALTIENENGLAIYKEGSQQTSTNSRVLGLTNLENLFTTTGLNKSIETLIKKGTAFDDDKKKLFKPVIRTKGDLILISKIAFNKAPLKITLYYQGEEIHSETLKGNGIVNRVYKLSENEKGNYKVVINTDNKVYNKDFSL